MPKKVDTLKPNNESVADYHKWIRDMKIKFVRDKVKMPDGSTIITGADDYAKIIGDQAKKLGKSANEYILDLIQDDIRSNPDGLQMEDFTIIRGVKELK